MPRPCWVNRTSGGKDNKSFDFSSGFIDNYSEGESFDLTIDPVIEIPVLNLFMQ